MSEREDAPTQEDLDYEKECREAFEADMRVNLPFTSLDLQEFGERYLYDEVNDLYLGWMMAWDVVHDGKLVEVVRERDELLAALKQFELIDRSDLASPEVWLLFQTSKKDTAGAGSIRLTGEFAKDASRRFKAIGALLARIESQKSGVKP